MPLFNSSKICKDERNFTVPIVRIENGKTFKCEDGVSILNAAEAAGLTVPYSCRNGRCSSCECTVYSGESELLADEIGKEHSETILACVRTPVTDLHISLADYTEWNISKPKTFPSKISSIEKLADDVVKVELRLPPNAELLYLAGQYVDIIGPGGIRRSYSIANNPVESRTLQLHIRRVQGGVMSQYWFDSAKNNDLLRLNGPLGTFFLRDVVNIDVVFLATGTGFAPVNALLEAVSVLPVNSRPSSVKLYWGGRTRSDIYANVDVANVNIEFIPVLSQADAAWQGRRGYVQHMLAEDTADLSNTVVYACGSNAMISDAKELLHKNGLAKNRFYSDAFVCSSKTFPEG
jgi:CDP-4-dehydro-6-deoxyglucose reductase